MASTAGPSAPATSVHSSSLPEVDGTEAVYAAGSAALDTLAYLYCPKQFNKMKFSKDRSSVIQPEHGHDYPVPANCDCPTVYKVRNKAGQEFMAGTCMCNQITAVLVPWGNGNASVVAIHGTDPWAGSQDRSIMAARDTVQTNLSYIAQKESAGKSSTMDDVYRRLVAAVKPGRSAFVTLQDRICNPTGLKVDVRKWDESRIKDAQSQRLLEHLSEQGSTPALTQVSKK